MKLSSHLPSKIPISVIYTQNQPDTSLFTGVMDTCEHMFGILGFDIQNGLIAPDIDAGKKARVSEYPNLMNTAFTIEKTLISD